MAEIPLLGLFKPAALGLTEAQSTQKEVLILPPYSMRKEAKQVSPPITQIDTDYAVWLSANQEHICVNLRNRW